MHLNKNSDLLYLLLRRHHTKGEYTKLKRLPLIQKLLDYDVTRTRVEDRRLSSLLKLMATDVEEAFSCSAI